MDNLKLQKLLLILIFLGIFILFILPEIGRPIITGEIARIEEKEKQTKIYLTDKEITIILFDSLNNNLETGRTIKVFGKEETYRGQKQIMAEKITLVKLK
ncbi:hypothetical protein HN747_01820 [archaeon]|jgi:hypothetical protein|nr:hypothetical protein [archaeon]